MSLKPSVTQIVLPPLALHHCRRSPFDEKGTKTIIPVSPKKWTKFHLHFLRDPFPTHSKKVNETKEQVALNLFLPITAFNY